MTSRSQSIFQHKKKSNGSVAPGNNAPIFHYSAMNAATGESDLAEYHRHLKNKQRWLEKNILALNDSAREAVAQSHTAMMKSNSPP